MWFPQNEQVKEAKAQRREGLSEAELPGMAARGSCEHLKWGESEWRRATSVEGSESSEHKF